ncbi:MAG: LysM peptidoglycan-binding domain-containing protein [Pedobacter sp.]|nr:LysM peptidoglycan-binding domain-containing protein [Chitinophagaceae bacterium]
MASIYKKILLFFAYSLLIIGTASAQNDVVLHTIKQGETLSALATKYGTSVGDIMRLNGMNSKSQLKIGEVIKIPSKATTATVVEVPKKEITKPLPVTKQPETNVTITDVTYTVLKGESLYGIAKKYKTTEAQLKIWNNLKDDKIKIGQVIVIGKEPMEKSTIPVTPKLETAKPIEDKPVAVTKPSTQPTRDAELTTLNSGSTKVSKPENTPVAPVKEVAKNIPAPITGNTKYVNNEGYFASYFDRKEKLNNTTTGDAAIFKTTSGWTDKKYYVLLNDVTQGTIVRLTANNKSVCAKVLGPLPDIKEDAGLLLRVSNAAAAVLGIEDTKFGIVVNY